MYRRRHATKTTLVLPGVLLMAALFAPGPAARAQDTPPPAPTQVPGAPSGDVQTSPDQTPPTEGSQEPERRRYRLRIGPQVGLFIPTDSKTRSRFGDSWFSFGLGIGNIQAVGTRGSLSLDLDVIYRKRRDNRALLIPIGVGYRKAFAAGSTRPYAGASLNLFLADLRSPSDNVRSGLRAAGGGSVFTGLTLSDNAYLEARYYLVSRIRTFDLSGLNVTAGYRF